MDLHDDDEGRIEIVASGFFGVQDVDWEHSARYMDTRSTRKSKVKSSLPLMMIQPGLKSKPALHRVRLLTERMDDESDKYTRCVLYHPTLFPRGRGEAGS
jgi:hypothetical protein